MADLRGELRLPLRAAPSGARRRDSLDGDRSGARGARQPSDARVPARPGPALLAGQPRSFERAVAPGGASGVGPVRAHQLGRGPRRDCRAHQGYGRALGQRGGAHSLRDGDMVGLRLAVRAIDELLRRALGHLRRLQLHAAADGVHLALRRRRLLHRVAACRGVPGRLGGALRRQSVAHAHGRGERRVPPCAGARGSRGRGAPLQSDRDRPVPERRGERRERCVDPHPPGHRCGLRGRRGLGAHRRGPDRRGVPAPLLRRLRRRDDARGRDRLGELPRLRAGRRAGRRGEDAAVGRPHHGMPLGAHRLVRPRARWREARVRYAGLGPAAHGLRRAIGAGDLPACPAHGQLRPSRHEQGTREAALQARAS